MKNIHIIKEIQPGSIAEELELVPGDAVLEVNHQEIEDVFDYHYLINDEYIELLVRKESGEEWELEIEKDYDEDLGITFESGLMSDYKSCSNKCIFVLLTSCQRACAQPCILKMTIRDFHFCRAIILP